MTAREEFENWRRSINPHTQFVRHETAYVSMILEDQWQAWQAARAPQAVPALMDGWLREFIDERRRLSFNLELHAHETAAINFFLDELEKAWRAAKESQS